MAEVIMVNPSANMKAVAKSLEGYGYKTLFVKTLDMPRIDPQEVFYFFSGSSVRFSDEIQGNQERDDNIFLFKGGLIQRWRLMNVGKSLASISNALSLGNFTDVTLFKRGAIQYDDTLSMETPEYVNIEEVCKSYPNSIILTASAYGASDYKMISWATDYDAEIVFGNNYFVFFTPRGKVECFMNNGHMVTVGYGGDHIESLAAFNKILKKFSFDKVEEKSVVVNKNPWFIDSPTGKFFIMNDYSFGSVSVNMPALWYDKCGNFISTNKSFKKMLPSIK